MFLAMSANAPETYSVEVSAVDEGGEGDGDAISQLLLVAQTQLALVVDLGPGEIKIFKYLKAINF